MARKAMPDVSVLDVLLSGRHIGTLTMVQGLRGGTQWNGTFEQTRPALGIEVLSLRPRLGYFNDDPRRLGFDALGDTVWRQLLPENGIA